MSYIIYSLHIDYIDSLHYIDFIVKANNESSLKSALPKI